MPRTERLDAKKIIYQAKRFQDYDLGGFTLNHTRLKNVVNSNYTKVALESKLHKAFHKSRGSVGAKLLPTLITKDESSSSRFNTHNRKALLTKGHHERSV